MPLISVVMTSYNHDKYISEAIESVLDQTFDDFELIIIDDASADRSQEIIKQYQQKDPRIRPIFHKKNAGISRTTNDGFDAVKGEYIAYMQSDDIWTPDKLRKQMHILSKNRNLIVWSDSLIIDGSGNSTGLLFTEKYKAVCKPKSGKLFSALVHDNYICGQSIIFDRKVIQEIQFDSRLFYANDYKFMLELSKKYEFYFIEEPLVRYRIHEDSSIHKNRAIWKKDFFKISKYVIQDCGDLISSTIKAKYYNRIGQYLYERKHFQYANKYIVRSIYMNPQKTSYYRRLVKSYVKSLV